MKHLFLTGEIQVGKSTLLKKWLSRIDLPLSGFYTQKIQGEKTLNVHIFPASSPEQPCEDNFLFDCYERNREEATERFNRLGPPLIKENPEAKLIIMDEIGIMEGNAEDFRRSVIEALEGDIPILGVIRKNKACPIHSNHLPLETDTLMSEIASHPNVEVIEVTVDNRDELAKELPPVLKKLEKS